MTDSASETLQNRFDAYFNREPALKAAKSLVNGTEIEFKIRDGGTGVALENFTFFREGGLSQVKRGPASAPQVTFTMCPAAADVILSDQSNEIGKIGIHILRQILSSDESRKIHVKLNSGFLTLFAKGYFGVVAAGGKEFASFLASHGLDGLGAIKNFMKKLRDS